LRTVAALLALSCVLVLIPFSQATGDCFTDTVRRQVCSTIPVDKPNTVPPAPTTPDTPYWGTYYLYLAAGECADNAIANDCTGRPTAPGSGVPLPTGGAIGSGQGVGTLYKESNGRPGLQRFFAYPAPADRIILV
jgi:hypothetical protein